MKRIWPGACVMTLVLVALGVLCPSAGAAVRAGSGWYWQNPLPQGSSYWSAWFNDADHGWFVSDHAIFHTSNGGATVSIQARHKVAFLDVTFADAMHGWAVGDPANANTGKVAIYRTVDGGHVWTRVQVNVRGGLHAVSFANAKVGWAVGDALLHTTDGGRHWARQFSVHTGLDLMDVQAVSARRAWVCGDGRLVLRTIDGGRTWKRLHATGGGDDGLLRQVQFTSRTTGWVNTDQAVVHTTDGGLHWARSLTANASGLSFADAQDGWVVSFDGTIYHTTDGGTSWGSQAGGTGLEWVRALSPSVAVTGGDGGFVSRTTDGADWQPRTRAADDFYGSLFALKFIDAATGWAAGSGGEVLVTTDGGAGWSPQTSGTGQDLHGLSFADAQHGWAVGDQGAIVHTSDGGVTWTPQSSGTSFDLTGVSFPDAQDGWATGQSFTPYDDYSSGVILHTTDGGQEWTTQFVSTSDLRTPSGVAFSAVAFADGQHGWAVGETQGSDAGFNTTVIMHTYNGGATWATQLQYVPPTLGNSSDAALTGVCCVDARHAVAVGYDDVRTEIFRTTNGGATWVKFSQSRTFPRLQLAGVAFADATHGWAVSSGAYGLAPAVIRTTDGGRTWTPQSLGSAENLDAVSFVSRTRGWVAGADANILTTTSGGIAP